MKDYLDRNELRHGIKLQGHMVVVTDERGEIIAQDISNDWMLDNIDFLRTFPIGRHFSKEGERVYPPRPKPVQLFLVAPYHRTVSRGRGLMRKGCRSLKTKIVINKKY